MPRRLPVRDRGETQFGVDVPERRKSTEEDYDFQHANTPTGTSRHSGESGGRGVMTERFLGLIEIEPKARQ